MTYVIYKGTDTVKPIFKGHLKYLTYLWKDGINISLFEINFVIVWYIVEIGPHFELWSTKIEYYPINLAMTKYDTPNKCVSHEDQPIHYTIKLYLARSL